MRRLIQWWGGVALLLVLASCGGEKDDSEPAIATAQPSPAPATAAQPAPTGGATRPIAGDPPASADTARIERLVIGIKLPPQVEIFGRRDITNDGIEKDAPDAGRRVREYGRQIGTYYLITVDGQPRMTLSVNQYATADGARRDFQFGRGNPAPEDRVDASGLGDEAAAHQGMLGSGETRSPIYLISFVRGRYYVIIADAPPTGTGAPPDIALELARAVDAQLKANPLP